MIKLFTMTYETVYGDVSEHGFCEPGWRYPVLHGKEFPEPVYLDLRTGLLDLGNLEPNDSTYLDARWWSETDGDTNYATGAVTRKAIHLPDGITLSSRRRINRLIRARR